VRDFSPSENRRQQILTAAARQFSVHGFHGANMRDVAADAGVFAGSIYYHFKSKEALFVAVHDAAVELMIDAVAKATRRVTDAWDRLEEAAAAHCETLNGNNPFVGVIAPSFPAALDAIRDELTAQRDRYEEIFKAMVDALPLDPIVDRKIFRLHILSALNGTKFWYHPDEKSPADIGRDLIRMLRPPVNAGAK
jgi:AcrR family transcriptional regulator